MILGDYRLTPRILNKRTGKPLEGFAIDLTLRFNGIQQS
jgi:hypothetical protein